MTLCLQIIFKNLTDNAKNIAANAKIEDMGRLFKTHMAGKQDVKSTISGVMDISKEVSNLNLKSKPLSLILKKCKLSKMARLKRICHQSSVQCWMLLLIQSNNTFMLGEMGSRRHIWRNHQSFRVYVMPSVCTHKQQML